MKKILDGMRKTMNAMNRAKSEAEKAFSDNRIRRWRTGYARNRGMGAGQEIIVND